MLSYKRKIILVFWQRYTDYHDSRIISLKNNFQHDRVLAIETNSHEKKYSFFHSSLNKIRYKNKFIFSEFFTTFQILIRLQPSIVLSCGYERPATLANVIYKYLFKKNVINILMLDNNEFDSKRNCIKEFIKRSYLNFFDKFYYGGSEKRCYLSLLGVPKNKIIYGYNSIDNKFFQIKSNPRISLPQNFKKKSYFLTVSRFVEEKNLFFTLNAISQISDFLLKKKYYFILFGQGVLENELKEHISRLKLDKVVLLLNSDDYPRSDIKALYSNAKFFLLSSTSEPWGLVVNEAMASKLPILISNQCGCSDDLVDIGINGYTFNPKKINELVFFIKLLVERRDLSRMGKHSLLKIRPYSSEFFGKRIKDSL